MDLHNAFDVPLPPAEAWKVLLDIPRIAPCMPGAELTEVVDKKTFKGKVSVKLGPVALAFNGTARFEDVDVAARTAKVSAQGADTKGRGGATAAVVFKLEPLGTGSKVVVDTNLNLSGTVAQYGRGTGMIQSVANQLIGQFAKNLEAELQRAPVAVAGAVAPEPAPDTHAAPYVGSAPARPTPPHAPVEAPRPSAKPISGLSLLWAAFLDALRGLFGRRS